MQKSGRLRLRPWLEEQIQSGKYPGVSWLDQSAQVFQIPWKHAARHGWSIDQDATLFRSWAMHTGRYHPGKDQPDPKTWKANFRCALNSLTDIRELQEQSRKRGSNAYRVYRMLPSKQTHRRGLRLSNITRVSQKCPGDEAQITNISNAEHSACALHATQHSTSEPTSDATNTRTHYPLNQGGPCVKVEFPAEELYNNNNNTTTHTHGLWEIRQENKEQTEAVFKLVDHLSNTELWSQSEEQRIWRTHTLWNHWPCGAGEDCLYTMQADSYLPWTETSDSIGEYYMKESSDWSTLQHLLTP